MYILAQVVKKSLSGKNKNECHQMSWTENNQKRNKKWVCKKFLQSQRRLYLCASGAVAPVDLRVSDIFDDFFSHQFWVCGKKGPMKSLCSRTPRNLQTVLLQTPIFYELFILMICFDAEWIAHKKNSNLWVTYDQRITFNYIDTCREGIFSFS